MNKIHKYISIMVAISLFSSCVFRPDPLDVEIDAPPPQLVVSSYALPPQILGVAISRTFSGLFSEDDVTQDSSLIQDVFVDDALVTIKYAGRTDTLFQLGPSFFGSLNVEQIPNERYTLYVKDNKTGQSITAETVFLETIPLNSAAAVPIISNDKTDTTFTFKYDFTDRLGKENYYLATYTRLNKGTGSLFDSLPGKIFNFQNSYFNIFTDQNKGDGKVVDFQPFIPNLNNGDTIAVSLSNIPKPYYEYLAAYKRSGNLFSSFLAEPITLPSNIVGGYGYFAMLKPDVKTVILR
jgi:hypothetical protein